MNFEDFGLDDALEFDEELAPYEPQTPAEEADYLAGCRYAWNAYDNEGVSIDRLTDRFRFFEDPRYSDCTAAFVAGCASQIRNFRAAEAFALILADD
ncbi:hypothetical protein Srufu_079090 (plasmid) [Streptomyces libani subsp. rufus]|nr:hypothetical protein Srufu_079090 [Streptomyces libani subsp. rufus]